MRNRLTKQALEGLKADDDLQFQVSKALNIRLSSLPVFINRNSPRFIEHEALRLISKKLGKKPSEIIEVSNDETKVAAQ